MTIINKKKNPPLNKDTCMKITKQKLWICRKQLYDLKDKKKLTKGALSTSTSSTVIDISDFYLKLTFDIDDYRINEVDT